ncbi:hypothetical protein [Kitasatospora sp. NPDC089509]|uniref:hypothetical protein n=1 Tax=Kitasatospora sp. NPDC089509 TaxID=3364079 RepID=UPI003814C85C
MQTVARRPVQTAAAVLAAGALTLTAAPLATAAPTTNSTATGAAAVAAAVNEATGTGDIVSGTRQADGTVRAETSAEGGNTTVTVPANAAGAIRTATGLESITVGLPGSGRAKGVQTATGTVVYPNAVPHADLAAQVTNTGFRATVTLQDAKAPREYRFPLHLPQGTRPVLQNDGSVSFINENGETQGGIKAPWAKDANGAGVATKFRLDGSTLVQSIDVNLNTAFPVVADPSGWWGWLKCSGAIGLFITSNMFVASKVAKAGGVAKVIVRLKAAENAADRYKALMWFFGDVTGAGTVISSCQ